MTERRRSTLDVYFLISDYIESLDKKNKQFSIHDVCNHTGLNYYVVWRNLSHFLKRGIIRGPINETKPTKYYERVR